MDWLIRQWLDAEKERLTGLSLDDW